VLTQDTERFHAFYGDVFGATVFADQMIEDGGQQGRLSFVTIGIMWANHHAVFRLIGRSTHGLIVEAAYDGFTERSLTRRAGEMLLVARKEG